jgi:hypothetical protein
MNVVPRDKAESGGGTKDTVCYGLLLLVEMPPPVPRMQVMMESFRIGSGATRHEQPEPPSPPCMLASPNSGLNPSTQNASILVGEYPSSSSQLPASATDRLALGGYRPSTPLLRVDQHQC